jgi:FKBP-type peptidyl-prolyl cis-trans isomerase FklB
MTSPRLRTLALTLLMAPASIALAQDKLDLKDPKVRASYAIGADIGINMKRQDLDLNAKAVAAGITDAFADKLSLTPEEMKQVLTAFQGELMAKMETRQKAAGEENLKKGQAFLEANAKKEGVKTTATGLQYKVNKSGTGRTPKTSDTVKVHYHGTLIDGTVFDSSVQRGEPISFPVNGVIKGWTEALQMMKEGDKWQIFLPANLAYGEQSPGPKIGPNSALIFDVELLAIEPAGK